MRRWQWWLVIVGLVVGWAPRSAHADEVEILLNKLVARGVLTSADAGDIREEIRHEQETTKKQVASDTLPESSKNWKWSGDIRLRNESRNRTGSGQDVNRQRIRFRYGFDAKVNDQLKVGARLATGTTTDPVSTNQTFDTSFDHKTIVLDRAFAEYTPEVPGIDKLVLTGGIIENPFWNVGQLVWDDDLNFDGAAVKLEKHVGSAVTLFTNDGVFPLQSGITETATLWSVQGGTAIKPFSHADDELSKNFKVTGALAYHDYMNVTKPLSESTAIATAGGAKGNTVGVADFNLLNPTIEVSSQYADIPFGVFGDFVHNTALASSKTNGFQLGLKVGKARVPFDVRKGWEGGYYFERLEPDATFGPFTDSDFGNGGTDHRGHVWWVKLATLKNSSLQLKYLNTQELKSAKNHADTFQADWVSKF